MMKIKPNSLERIEDRIRVLEKYARTLIDEAQDILRICQEARREIGAGGGALLEQVMVPQEGVTHEQSAS